MAKIYIGKDRVFGIVCNTTVNLLKPRKVSKEILRNITAPPKPRN